ncbi:receptor-type protein kinase, putative, partial [Bodo saltans]
ITDAGLASVGTLQQQRQLTLHGFKKITDLGLASVATLQQLQDLCLDLDKCTDAGLARVASLHQLHRLGLFGWLEYHRCRLCESCHFPLQQLRFLLLCDCNNLTDAALLSIVALHQLRSLYLTGCSKFTDAGFALAAALKQLYISTRGPCSIHVLN